MKDAVRQFLNAARQHLLVARLLVNAHPAETRSPWAYHAVYIGGYAVECALKAAMLSRTPLAQREALMADRLKALGHNLEGCEDYLRTRLNLPLEEYERRMFRGVIVPAWDVNDRYRSGHRSAQKAAQFLNAASAIVHWAERMTK